MAKKVRRKLEEEEEAAFEFPVFDEVGFVSKEYELGVALALAAILMIAMGLVSWALWYEGVPWWGPLGLGFLILIASPFLIARVRRRSGAYTKGDWAALLTMEFFGWFALWFVLVNLT
ncbi:MAG TPA: hypothetical protein VEH57_01880 [Thermoplasmata archaeon]|nr:hypothetical protein [Thermoplasmata archaeon]